MPFDKLGHLKMIWKKPFRPAIWGLSLALLATFGLINGYAQITEALPSKSIELTKPLVPVTQWNILDKLQEKDDELEKAPVSIGPKEITYYENRISILPYETKSECARKKGVWDEDHQICKSIKLKRLSDKERSMGFKLLNTVTGDIEIIKVSTKITADGVKIIASPGYQIEIVEEPNGVKWNLWYTFYRVVSPANTAVIKSNFPIKTTVSLSKVVKGKVKKQSKEMVQGVLYVPHSDFFERSDQEEILVKTAVKHLKNDVAKAFSTLRERGVLSKSFPGKLVADVEELSPRFFERLPLLEQGDFTKFKLDPEKTVKRVLIRLATNGENAWRYTCNSSRACGLVQFTPPTYRDMGKFYPAALLEKDFKTGAGDHVNSLMSGILLADSNLSGLLRKGNKAVVNSVLTDPVLREEFIDSSHNGNPDWAHNALTAAVLKGLPDWVYALSPTRKDFKGGLRKETRDFMTKLRYLVANDLP